MVKIQNHQQLVKAHHQPRPHLEEGKWIAGQKSVHTRLDVSDGIDSDIRRIREESSVGAKIDVNDITVSSSLKSVCRQHNWNAIEIAATGGEDYCLLWTADPAQFNRLANAFQQQFDKPLYTIGRIAEGDTLVYYQDVNLFFAGALRSVTATVRFITFQLSGLIKSE
jgi:thiamine-monophosphate kinase